MCYIRSDQAPKDRIFAVVAAENGLKTYSLLLDNFAVAQGSRWPSSSTRPVQELSGRWTVTHHDKV